MADIVVSRTQARGNVHVDLVVRAWIEFLYIGLISVFGFRTLQRVITKTVTRSSSLRPATIETVVAAVDLVSVLRFRPVRCLKRSAVLTRLLRQRGVPADMVVGVTHAPFKSHAWVEVAGELVGDSEYSIEHLHVLDRW